MVSGVTLSGANNWGGSWNDIDGAAVYSVVEAPVPEDYEVSYAIVDGVMVVTNSYSEGNTDDPTTPPTFAPPSPTATPTATPDGETPSPVPTATPEHTNDPKPKPTDTPEASFEPYTAVPTMTPSPEPTEGSTATPEVTEEPTATPEATEGPTATPEVTKPPQLPQTGQLIWPIPILIGGGLVLFMLGWFFIGRRRKNDEDKQKT
jgi:LPXTG-motif cell wall-anchored protein